MIKQKKRCWIIIMMLLLSLALMSGCSSEETGEPVDTEMNGEEETEDTSSVKFSAAGGFYDKGFMLSLTATENGKIFYTTDGSDPRTSDTAIPYTGEIRIYNNTNDPNVYSAVTDISLGGYMPPDFNVDKGMVIRAVEQNADGEFGDVGTNCYFVDKKKTYYNDFRVISMVTDGDYLFDEDTGIYMIGSKYYEWLESDEYTEYDSGDVANPTNYNTSGRETEIPVTIQVFENGVSVYKENVGARIAGNWTRSGAQKSFRLYARKEYGNSKMEYMFFDELTDVYGEDIEKFDKVTLRNGGNDHVLHFRDALFQELTQGLELDYMASEPCILFLNGEFWGFYLLREKPEDYYIQSHYGIDDKEVAVIKNGELESGAEEDLEDYRQFTIWAATADMTKEENYREFCEKMDVQSFMDYMTVETYINNHDWACGYSNNWIVWRSNTVDSTIPRADGKWRFILYDLDFAAGLYESDETAYWYDTLNNMYIDSEEFDLPEMLKNLCRNEEFKQAFYDNYIAIMENCFDSSEVDDVINDYVKTYGKAMKDTHERFGAVWAADCYEDKAKDLKTYFKKRPGYALDQLNYFIENIGKTAESDPGEDTVTAEDSDNIIPSMNEWFYYGDALLYIDDKKDIFYASVPNPQEYSWNIQCGTSNITLKNGQKYRLTFEASCDGTGELELFFNRYDNGDYPTEWLADVKLTKDMKTYEFEFTFGEKTNSDWRLCFNFGLGKGDYVIQNVRLTKAE